MNNLSLGRAGESAAVKFLKACGYKILEQNYHKSYGEIDIVAMDGETLCFIEVKTRENLDYGHPFEAVTPSKQRNIRKMAKTYLMEKEIENIFVRFDVVGILSDPARVITIDLLKDAFQF
ncbi:MAG: YraN family protein [Candidatus Omnitrophota bacterium]